MYSINEVNKYILKLKHIAEDSLKNNDYDKSLSAISSCADILYLYNQYYVDDELEDLLLEISKRLFKKMPNYKSDKKVVLFYDGFGLDIRGLAIVLTRAIAQNGYKLVYVTKKSCIKNQPNLKKALNKFNVEYCYINTNDGYLSWANQIMDIFYRFNPFFAFFYTFPSDVSGCIAFNSFKGLVKRLQIDLTDHAFWLGINAFDYIISGRNYSVSIQHFYRRISYDKMIFCDLAGLPFVPEVEYKGLPFDENILFIFSGGALYKTLGDPNKTFYKIVDHILNNHKNINFYYVGEGNDCEIRALMDKYKGRVYISPERDDFFEVYKRCLFFLNTYPMFGGMMMRYAALAGKLPLTYKHNNEADGILQDQKNRMIEYNDYNLMVQDIDKLIDDNKYLKEREKKLDGAVFTEEVFANHLKNIIEKQTTNIFCDFSLIEKVDTTEFRNEYLNRFKYGMIIDSITKRNNICLLFDFPLEFVYAFFKKVYNRIKPLLKKWR